MEGRAGLCKEPCAACSGALPRAPRLKLSLPVGKGSLHAPLRCGPVSTSALSCPTASHKGSGEGWHHGRLLLFFFFFFKIHFYLFFFITKISAGARYCPGQTVRVGSLCS